MRYSGLSYADKGGVMVVSTSHELAGYHIDRVVVPVFGLTVRCRNAFPQAGAGIKSIFGGELKGTTKNLEGSRQRVVERMQARAEELCANAVVRSDLIPHKWEAIGLRSVLMELL